MRVLQLLTVAAVFGVCMIGVAVGDDKVIAPPRLRIRTEPEMSKAADTRTALKVEAVAPSGLGAQLGLAPGDFIESFKLADRKPMTIKTTDDLLRALIEVREVTLIRENKEKSADITFQVLQNGQRAKAIEGKIFRTDFFDKTDGGTLYYFRPKNAEFKDSPAKKKP